MTAFDVATFMAEVKPGMWVRILATSGREHLAIFVAAGTHTLSLRRNDGSTFSIPFTWVSDWMLSPTAQLQVDAHHVVIPTASTAAHSGELLTAGAPQADVSPSPSASVALLGDGVDVSSAALRPLSPVFTLPVGLAYARKVPVSRALAQLKDKWQHAHAIHEPDRLAGCLSMLERSEAENPDLGIFSYDLGCLHQVLARPERAITAFLRVPDSPVYASACYNLAAAALSSGRAQLCWAGLQQFFASESLEDREEAWRIWAALGVQFGVWSQLERTLSSHHQHATAASAHAVSHAARTIAIMLGGDLGALDPRADIAAQTEASLATIRRAVLGAGAPASFSDSDAITVLRGRQAYTPKPAASVSNVTQARSSSRSSLRSDQELTTYQRATRAQQDRDFPNAERLFREALAKNEYRDGVVKGLAMLLVQQGRKEEAIELLEDNLNYLRDKKPALNILATTYTHVRRNHEAIEVLEEILALSRPDERAGVLKRVAYCHYMLKEYDDTDRVLASILRLSPGDDTALRWRAGLASARQTGVYTEADALFDAGVFTEVSYNVSPTLTFALERCDFAGVVDTVVASRSFTHETLKSVGALIDKQRARPRERARYLLTYARLLQELNSEDYESFRNNLFAYSCAMADTCASQKRPLDVTRAYYAEALFLRDKWDVIVNRVVQYLRSFVVRSEDLLPIDGKSAPLDETIASVCGGATPPPHAFWVSSRHVCHQPFGGAPSAAAHLVA